MKQPDAARRGSGDTPISPNLLAEPLDFISEDHLRERQLCAVIEAFAEAPSVDRHSALSILRFLNEELNVHLRDEAEDLFPLLEKRCKIEDSIESAMDRIRFHQAEAMRLLPEVRATLAVCLDTGAGLTEAGRAKLTALARHVRRHLVAENAILLPIARARLSRADLRVLSDQMRLRRGLPLAREATDAE